MDKHGWRWRGLLAGLGVVGLALGVAEGRARSAESRETIKRAADLKFTELRKGVTHADLWGDSDKGAYGGMLKFAAGAATPRHTHSSDMKLVVIGGTFLYTGVNGAESRLGPGSYVMIPAHTRHMSACAAGAECSLLVEQPGKFDFQEAVGVR